MGQKEFNFQKRLVVSTHEATKHIRSFIGTYIFFLHYTLLVDFILFFFFNLLIASVVNTIQKNNLMLMTELD